MPKRRGQEVEAASRQVEHRLREKRQQVETLNANAVGMLGALLGKLQRALLCQRVRL
jgi:hypothetical protein